jgi:phenylpropionate dioxygenase-like ring-hydroxylating dioxygenase large terminal subunit
MIRDQWYIIMESREVRRGKPVGVTRLGEKLVLWRDSQDTLHCMGDTCPHMHAPLHKGKIAGDRIACPFHGFQYDASGQCTYLPAVGKNGRTPPFLKTKVYPAYESRGFIYIYWGEPEGDLAPPQFFESLPHEEFHVTRFRDHWPTHYARMLENQLDVCHLPFVHHNTIGRGQGVVVEGPYVELADDLLNIWSMNRVDDGSPVRPITHVEKPARHPSLQFIFPNLWHNWIADDIRIVIAFVPVDNENSIMYGRFYQRVLKIPLLRGVMGFFGVIGSHVIARQDKRVVTRITPKNPAETDTEHLRVSDLGIIQYRKRKQELQASTKPAP